MGQGLVGSFGLQGLQQAIRQRVADQMLAKRQEQEMAMAERRMALQEQEQGLRHGEYEQAREERKANFERQKHGDEMAQRDKELTQSRALNDQIPADTFIEDAPENKPLLGRLQMVGGATMQPNQQERPAVEVGPLLPGDSGQAKLRGYLKLASEKQTVDATNRSDKLADNDRAAKADAARRAHELKMEQLAARRGTERQPHRVVQQGIGPDGTPILLSVDLDSGQATPIEMPTGVQPNRPAKPVTGAERQTLAFYNRMKDSLANVEPKDANDTAAIEDFIAKQGLAGQLRGQYAHNVLQTKEQQLYRQAQRAYTEARLRKESGAAIPESEFENDARTYFVQPGDKPETVAQKRTARRTVLEGLKNASGGAYKEFYGADANGAPVHMQAPDGRSLTVPADKVAEMEAHGAKRVP